MCDLVLISCVHRRYLTLTLTLNLTLTRTLNILGLIGEGLLDYEPLGELGSPIRAAQKLPVEMGSGASAADVVARLDRIFEELQQAHTDMKIIHQVC